ncbi:hypothetical protein M5D96_004174 [Drosophila gunungcola]|uniref:Uncharacterized protein n=1 Tax=Drosophila gunungcola TaxID=103775 RepID=A0A9P9YTL1_9MUSC|nr:hypothetical protein M5D96_004174 [Drosophila gunungcola]
MGSFVNCDGQNCQKISCAAVEAPDAVLSAANRDIQTDLFIKSRPFQTKVLTRVVGQIGLVVILIAAPFAIWWLLGGIIDVIGSARGHYPGTVLLDDTLHFLLEDVKDIGRALELNNGKWEMGNGKQNVIRISMGADCMCIPTLIWLLRKC